MSHDRGNPSLIPLHSIQVGNPNEDIGYPQHKFCPLCPYKHRLFYRCTAPLLPVPAKYLQVVLNTLDHPSILIEWHRLLAGLIHEITSDSVLFMISAHGDSQRYLPIFECAKKRGITTILLTSEKNSPLLSLSTIWMCSNDQNEECHHVDINSRLGIITLIQLIIELAAQGTIKENS